MPTGYTSDLYHGKEVSFKQFALTCARAFGAFIDLRDDPTAKIPRGFKPSSYHLDERKKCERRLREALGWTPKAAEGKATQEYLKAVKARDQYIKDSEKRAAAYRAMDDKVSQWAPPTKEHDELKKFMWGQLAASIKHDCLNLELPTPVLKSPEDYIADIIVRESEAIRRHRGEYAKEVARCKERGEWVRQLVRSLK